MFLVQGTLSLGCVLNNFADYLKNAVKGFVSFSVFMVVTAVILNSNAFILIKKYNVTLSALNTVFLSIWEQHGDCHHNTNLRKGTRGIAVRAAGPS